MIATEQELAAFIRDADGPLRIQGGGTRMMLGQRCGGTVLSTAKLSGISLYEPAARTLVAQSGTPLSEIEKTLAEKGKCCFLNRLIIVSFWDRRARQHLVRLRRAIFLVPDALPKALRAMLCWACGL